MDCCNKVATPQIISTQIRDFCSGTPHFLLLKFIIRRVLFNSIHHILRNSMVGFWRFDITTFQTGVFMAMSWR